MKFAALSVRKRYMQERDDIDQVAKLLLSGGIICYPTDTIWGIGCDVRRTDAIERINKLKGRPPGKAYVLLVSSIDMLKDYVKTLHPRIETLLNYHQRPLTIIYPEARNLPPEAVAPDGSVAIRVTRSRLCRELIEAIGAPLVSTSANVSGQPYPKNFGEISSEIIENVDYVSKENRWDLSDAQPSTIAIATENGILEFVRP